MRRIVLDAVEDMLENLGTAIDFAAGMERDAFLADRKTLYAVMRALEIVGEAAKRVPAETTGRFSTVPWRRMAGLRDIIVHQYDRIDGGVLYDIVTTQAPAAVTELADVVAVLRTEADA